MPDHSAEEVRPEDRFYEGGGAKFWYALYKREQAERFRLERLIRTFVEAVETARFDGTSATSEGGSVSE